MVLTRQRKEEWKIIQFQSLFKFLQLFIIHIFFFLFTPVYIRTRLHKLRYNVFISCSNSNNFCLELNKQWKHRTKNFQLCHWNIKTVPCNALHDRQAAPTFTKFPLQIPKLKQNKFHNSHGSLGHYLLKPFPVGKEKQTLLTASS